MSVQSCSSQSGSIGSSSRHGNCPTCRKPLDPGTIIRVNLLGGAIAEKDGGGGGGDGGGGGSDGASSGAGSARNKRLRVGDGSNRGGGSREEADDQSDEQSAEADAAPAAAPAAASAAASAAWHIPEALDVVAPQHMIQSYGTKPAALVWFVRQVCTINHSDDKETPSFPSLFISLYLSFSSSAR